MKKKNDDTALATQNPGSRGWAAGGAFGGLLVGAIPGTVAGYALAEETPDGKKMMPVWSQLLAWAGGVAGAAGGAAMGAPEHLKKRAAAGAAIGAVVPLLGGVLAPLGAYIATKPDTGRKANLTPTATIAITVIALAGAGGLTYAGVKAWKKRKALKEAEKPMQLIYDVRELPGLQIDIAPGDDLIVETGGEDWAVSTEYPVEPIATGWRFGASTEFAGTWDVFMDRVVASGEAPEQVAFTIKVHAA